jgi:hypothetical protein
MKYFAFTGNKGSIMLHLAPLYVLCFLAPPPPLYFFPSHMLASPPFLVKNFIVYVCTIDMLDSVTSSVWCLVCRPAKPVTYLKMFSNSVRFLPPPTNTIHKFIALN